MPERGLAAVAALAALLAACSGTPGEEAATEAPTGDPSGVVYGVGDDLALWRWEAGSDEPERALDLSGVWDHQGDVDRVLTASLSVDPTQRHAAWIAGGDPGAELMVGDLDTGDTRSVVDYPLDHGCLDPVWAPDGSRLLVHRADVWEGTEQAPPPTRAFGDLEWYSPEGERLDDEIDLDEGCRLRWYTADGEVRGLHRDVEVTELYRVDERGGRLETAAVADFEGVDPAVTDLVEVAPSGRYACIADGYDEHETYEGGFTIRPETGTNVIDLETGSSVGSDCEALADDGYLARDEATVAFAEYGGGTVWEAPLPDELANSPDLFYFP
ncbi:hypothetical protein [Glycomyces xiaoerkulensis]|uniref:hypothetical protein n=1 Tax=Glycomyces xiaoerkulensis TaxID=2038139 RepID=UPI000C267DDA|nr:hypothetical protein [Glycomyces xiaoerkulensis]